MLRLSCAVQQYEWGKPGADSAVARLQAKGEGKPAAADKPYAEYWFGTHPSGPSKVVTGADGSAEPLQDWLLAHPAALGCPAYDPTTALPYLLKVLSVAKALSVQAHPDKALAQRLHAERPALYKDGNHKPEMALAVTPFEAMCSFRCPHDMAYWLRATPELRALVGEEPTARLLAAAAAFSGPGSEVAPGVAAGAAQRAFSEQLRAFYCALMEAPDAAVAAATQALHARLAKQAAADDGGSSSGSARSAASGAASPAPAGCTLLDADAVALRLLAQYPGDVGAFSPYLLNTLRLAPGTGLFLGANEPHAYLAGDCVEVMACSDNVVRAGLTPKFKDVPTLTAMLTYAASGRPAVTTGCALDGTTVEYPAPVPEFCLQRTAVGGPGPASAALPPAPSAAIVVVFGGAGTARCVGASGAASSVALSEGQIWLQPADVAVTVEAAGGEALVLFRAHAAKPGAAEAAVTAGPWGQD